MIVSRKMLALCCAAGAVLAMPSLAHAHGNVKCNSGPAAGWKPIDDLKRKLTSEGWTVRKAHPSKDCYEVYGTTPEGDKVESFFHPVTFAKVLVLRRGQVLYKAP